MSKEEETAALKKRIAELEKQNVDLSYLADPKLEKNKKSAAEFEKEFKGQSNKEAKKAAEEEKAAKAARKLAKAAALKGAPAPDNRRCLSIFFLLFMFAGGFVGFVFTISDAIMGNGVVDVDYTDTAKLKEVLFGGEPWLVWCINNVTKHYPLPKVLDEGAWQLWKNIGVSTAKINCFEETSSGRSIASKYKFREDSPPLSFVVANGDAPKKIYFDGIASADALEQKITPGLKQDIKRVDQLKQWPKLCTSRKSCLVVGYRQKAQLDTAMNVIRPLMKDNRGMKIVSLDTSFWSLKLDGDIVKRRPTQEKGNKRATVLCLARREDADEVEIDGGNSTHSGDFLQDISDAANFMQACSKRQNLLKIDIPPKIAARPTKPKVVKPPPVPSPPPSQKRSTDSRSGGGSSAPKKDSVGSRAKMEEQAQEDALFEAVDSDETVSEVSDGEDSSSGEDDDTVEL